MKKTTLSKIFIVLITLVACGDGALWMYARHHTVDAGRMLTNKRTFAQVHDTLLQRHLIAQANAPMQKLVITSPEVATTIKEYDITHAKAHLEIAGGGEPISEMISTGAVYYVKDFSDNKWWAQAVTNPQANQKEFVSSPDYAKNLRQLNPHVKFTAQGQEYCGNLHCYKYKQQDDFGTTTIWFDSKSFLLQKTEATNEGVTVAVHYSYSGFSISTPTLTKPVPQSKSIFDYAFSNGSTSNTDKRSTIASPQDRAELEQLQRELDVESSEQ